LDAASIYFIVESFADPPIERSCVTIHSILKAGSHDLGGCDPGKGHTQAPGQCGVRK
jgi:hypothetical protein